MPDGDEPSCDSALILRELAREYTDINWGFFKNRLTPLPLLLSDHTSLLGRFTSDPRRIELSRALVLGQPWGSVIEVLKHEMAHQFVAEVLGEHDETSHGPSFQRVCERLGIDARASGLPHSQAAAERSPILERIRKLFALAQSANQHEAETAMRMAHRLMLRHNLAQPSETAADGYGFRHLGRATGRISEAESVLAGLLGEFFFVQPIWVSVFRVSDGKRVSTLEVTGRHENLALAEYVHGFLLRSADALWLEHKRKHRLGGNGDRRAFQAGVMRGFAEKLRAERKSEAASGLVWVADPVSEQYFRARHPRVRNSSYGNSGQSSAANHGRAAGRDLVLSRPLAQGPSQRVRALPSGGHKQS
ncbi:MAG: DUF2786 domain-containing protein [Polyangiales bacterium]